jgi:hypothetical protein
MHTDTAHRGHLLYVALGFLGLDVPPATMLPGLRALHDWLDTWHGIGLWSGSSRSCATAAPRSLSSRREGNRSR